MYSLSVCPYSLPGLTLLQPNFILALLPNAFVVAIITFAITVSVGQVFAQQLKYSINSDQVCVCLVVVTDYLQLPEAIYTQ